MALLALKQEAQSPPPSSLPPTSSMITTPPGDPGHTPRDPLGLEVRILTLCALNSKGITDYIIVQDQPTIDAEKRMRALQRLLSQVRLVGIYWNLLYTCWWALIGVTSPSLSLKEKIELPKQGHSLVYWLKATSSTPRSES